MIYAISGLVKEYLQDPTQTLLEQIEDFTANTPMPGYNIFAVLSEDEVPEELFISLINVILRDKHKITIFIENAISGFSNSEGQATIVLMSSDIIQVILYALLIPREYWEDGFPELLNAAIDFFNREFDEDSKDAEFQRQIPQKIIKYCRAKLEDNLIPQLITDIITEEREGRTPVYRMIRMLDESIEGLLTNPDFVQNLCARYYIEDCWKFNKLLINVSRENQIMVLALFQEKHPAYFIMESILRDG